MPRSLRKLMLSLAFAAGAIVVPALATPIEQQADGKKKDEPKKSEKGAEPKESAGPPAKLPDWSKEYASGGDPVVGIISKVDDDSVTIGVPVAVPSSTGGRRPSMRQEYKFITMKLAEGALVRSKEAPVKPDAKGKFVKLPANELAPLKKPQGAPGYHMDKAELKPGHIVSLELLRPKTIPSAKATLEDKVVKFVVVTGETDPPRVSRDEAENRKKDEQKKKKDK